LGNLKGREQGRSRRSWEDNIKIDLWEVGWEGVDWMHLALCRDQWSTLVNTSELSGSIEGEECLD
jgi:hypothetical protein